MFLTLVAALAFQQSSLVVGDTWTVDRPCRFLNEIPKIDFTSRSEIQYKVDSVDARGIVISQSRRFLGSKEESGTQIEPAADPKVSQLKFGPGGAPNYKEDPSDLLQARIDRVQWSAGEDRAGVSWTRHFVTVGELPAAKVTIKPTSKSSDSLTVAVTYVEDKGVVKGEATVVVSLPKRIVTSLKMTLNGVTTPANGQPVKIVINQTLAASKG